MGRERYEWWVPGEEDNPQSLLAHDQEDAAEEAAQEYHSRCGGEWNTGTQRIIVRGPTGLIYEWDVEIDYVPIFSASELI